MPDRVPTYAELPVVEGAPPRSAWGVFGRDDQLGTLNFLTPERRLTAVNGVRRGEVFSLDLPLHLPRPPMIASRTAYRRTQIQFPMNRGRDDVLDNFYLQCSSQWDSLKHIRHPEYGFYNWTPDERVDSEQKADWGSTISHTRASWGAGCCWTWRAMSRRKGGQSILTRGAASLARCWRRLPRRSVSASSRATS